jgi:triacylglycerol esterase/lipase EstA (alpha/beta hydrolase family)
VNSSTTSLSTIPHHRVSLGQSYALLAATDIPTTAAVFVHGFHGDPEKTWHDFQTLIDTSVESTEEWSHTDLYFFGYESVGESIENSAFDLIQFVRQIFPRLELALDNHPEEGSAPTRRYDKLVLVGHSQGCVVIRAAIAHAGQLARHDSARAPILRARLSLFAPAHFGYTPTKLFGAVVILTGIKQLHDLYVAHSPSATEMKDKEYLEQLRRITEYYYQQSPETPAYSAHVLFGREEQIVVRQRYLQDCSHRPQEKKDHFQICKPTVDYLRPLHFVFGDCQP